MKRIILIALWFSLIGGTAHATAVAHGNMDFTGLQVDSNSIDINVSGLIFAYSTQLDSTGNAIQNNLALDPVTYTGSGVYGLNRVAGSFNRQTGESIVTEAYARSPGNGQTNTMQTNFSGKAGIYNGVLNPFSYNYNFSGQTDSPDSRLIYNVQMAISYWEPELTDWKYIYSDYHSWADNFRTNWFHKFDADSDVVYSGTRSFDYSSLGSKRWQIEWSFDIEAKDFSDLPSGFPIPEPAAILLFGLGLLGLSGMARKQK